MALTKINFQNGTIVRSNFLNEIQKGTTFSGINRADYYSQATDTEQSSWMIGERDGIKDWELDDRYGIGSMAASGRINNLVANQNVNPVTYIPGPGIPSVIFFNPETGQASIDPYISVNKTIFIDNDGKRIEKPTASLAIKDNNINYIYYKFDTVANNWILTYTIRPLSSTLNGFPSSETLNVPLAKISLQNGVIPVDSNGSIFHDGGFVDYRQGLYSGYLNSYSSQLVNTDIKIFDYQAENLDRVLCNTAAGSFIVTLPEFPEDGTRIAIVDIYGHFDQFPLVLKPFNNTVEGIDTPKYSINGSADNWILNTKNAYISLFYSELANDWRFEDLPLDESILKLGKFISCGGREILPNILTAESCPTGTNVPSVYPNPSLGTYFWDSTQGVCYAEFKSTTALYGDGTVNGTIKEFNAKRCTLPEDVSQGANGNKRNIIYVDPIIGNDAVSNDGNLLTPFRTIERAILEGARRSYRRGPENDLIDSISISLAPGDYYIDNTPGGTNINDITTLPAGSTGLLSQKTITNTTVTQNYDPISGYFVATLPATNSRDLIPYGIQIGRVVYSSSGGVGTISRLKQDNPNSSSWKIYIEGVSGNFSTSDELSYDYLSRFNPTTGGLIIPRGISITGNDLRKVKIRPMYVPSVSSGKKTAIFKVTGNTYISQMTFTDNRQFNISHSAITTIEYASKCELVGLGAQLSDGTVGPCSGEVAYYAKINKVFNILDGYTTTPEGRNDEWSIVTKAFLDRAQRYTDNEVNLTGEERFYNDNGSSIAINDSYGLQTVEPGPAINSNPEFFIYGLPDINSTRSSSPYVFNCSVRSIYGLNGMHADGSKIEGLRSMVVAQFTQVSLQVDPNAFNGPYKPIAPSADREKRFKDSYRHFGFKASNDSYIQIVSCFVIGNADHFISESGGDLSITNSCSDFGDVSLKAIGYKVKAFSQDIGPKDLSDLTKGTQVVSIVPAKPLAGAYVIIPDPTKVGNISTGLGIDFDTTKTVGDSSRIYISLSGQSIENPPSANTLSGGGRFSYTNTNGQYLSGPAQYQKLILPNKEGTGIFTADFRPPIDNNGVNYFNLDPNLRNLDDKSRVFGWDSVRNKWYYRVQPGNSIYQKISTSQPNEPGGIVPNSRFTIRRDIDRRSLDQRIYRLRVKGFTGSVRRPLPGYILQSQEFNWSQSLSDAFIVANVQDFEPGLTNQLNNKENLLKGIPNVSDMGEYILTLLPLTSEEASQALVSGAYYPTVDYDNPEPNPNSLAKQAIQLYTTFGVVTQTGQSISVSPGESEIQVRKTSEFGLIPNYIELRRPSLIRATNHTWEWVGYLNYDTALPSLQGNSLTSQEKSKKIITEVSGGRVYATGMDEDGIFRIGSFAYDLKTNKQFDISIPGAESPLGGGAAIQVKYNEELIDSNITTLNFVGYSQVTSEGSIATIPLESEPHLPIRGGTLTGTLNGTDANFTGITSITNGTASSSKTTGALVVSGGVGIGGDLNVGGDIAAFSTSDSRLKENIYPLTDALSKLDKISGVTYNWNSLSGKDTNKKEVGVIAQEVLSVLPEAVTKRDNGYLAVDYERIIPLLIEAIKELKNEVEGLKNVN